MNGDLFGRVKQYKIALAVIKEMLSDGVLTDDDLGVICTVLAKEYGLSSCSIFAGIDLISGGTHGNI